MPKDTGIWTTAEISKYSNLYINEVKKALNGNPLFDKALLRENIVVVWINYPNDDEDYPGSIEVKAYTYRDNVLKYYEIDHYTWIEQKEEYVQMDEFHIFPEDIISDGFGKKVRVLKIDVKTKEDWDIILKK